MGAARQDEAGSFSKGMRQKLALARALLHEPRVLFLDEPTSGLDPEAAKLVRDFIAELKAEGRTIFLCTHNLEEADRLCDRVGIFKTRLITVDSPANIRQRLYGRRVVLHLAQPAEPLAERVRRAAVHQRRPGGGQQAGRRRSTIPRPTTRRSSAAWSGPGAEIQFVGELRHSLEDVYLRLIEGAG